MRPDAFVERISPKDHVMLLYDDPDEECWIAARFLKSGLQEGKAPLYITPNPIAETRDAMRSQEYVIVFRSSTIAYPPSRIEDCT